MKILEYHQRVSTIMKTIKVQRDNHENHKNLIISQENNENYENARVTFTNHEIH